MGTADDIQRLREAIAVINLRLDQQTDAQAAVLRKLAEQAASEVVGNRLMTDAERQLLLEIAAERARWEARREQLVMHLLKGGAWGLAALALAMWWDSLKAMVTGRTPMGG